MLKLGPRDRVAAFDVDAQNCFTELCPAELPVPDGVHIVSELNRQADIVSLRLGSKDAHPANAIWEADDDRPALTPVEGHKNVDLHWPRHGVPGTFGFELLEGLPEVSEYDYFVWKGVEPDIHPYGACFHDLACRRSTGAIEFLRDRGIDVVVVGGLALDYCVKVTALQLAEAGFRVIVNQGATRGLAPESSAEALRAMAAAGVELVESANDLQVG
ncbi:isochorismatase family protein [Sansalvadorimonas sp. 2012CJ34-2]|uniref:nicotinamidase n=1 Tax=Parendozoicomonas callyspongiae TaxID=2942213 RepID=A0ABT0PJI3_9GAMM|nr:isochorismatase family protein [Sansalvadorimonas sp. 2012CJ34-2]MCL6271493.1 isochorismatase family protein [Sansalvadorimonas sp. 2012CJ34-2]